MVRKYIRVPDGNDTPNFDDLGFPIAGRGKPIGVVLGELQGDHLVFGYSLVHPNDEYIQAKADLTAYGKLFGGKYSISMRWSDEEINHYFRVSPMSKRVCERIQPIIMWMRDEYVRHPEKCCKMPAYFPYIVQHVTGVEVPAEQSDDTEG